MRAVVHLFNLVVITGTLVSCNDTRIKAPPDTENQIVGELKPGEKVTLMNYNFINSRIIGPKCTSCHGTSGNVSLENYNDVKTHLAKIKTTVFIEKTMPKLGTLTSEEKRLFWNWLQMGAPLDSEGATPPDAPLIATYDSIQKHIFEPKCTTCHNPVGTGKRVLLDKQALLDSPLELVLAGNADESGLVIALERTDGKRMPPANEGYSALKPEVIQVIRDWINNGAN